MGFQLQPKKRKRHLQTGLMGASLVDHVVEIVQVLLCSGKQKGGRLYCFNIHVCLPLHACPHHPIPIVRPFAPRPIRSLHARHIHVSSQLVQDKQLISASSKPNFWHLESTRSQHANKWTLWKMNMNSIFRSVSFAHYMSASLHARRCVPLPLPVACM